MTSTPDPMQALEELEQRFYWINAKWNIYKQLFATSSERVDLMNEMAPTFFAICQDVFVDDVLLALGRLSDPPRSMGRDNLSLAQIIQLLRSGLPPNLVDEIDRQAARVDGLLASFRVTRNRRLAHTDLEVALSPSPSTIAPKTMNEIDAVIAGISQLLNLIQSHFKPDTEIAYTHPILHNDGEALISALEQAQAVRRAERERRGRS